MKALLLAIVIMLVFLVRPDAHGGSGAVTWNREIARIVYDKCASCHRPGGTAFSLMTYVDVQPRSSEIKDAVLSRRMPPWGAVKGFGAFRNDQSLSQEQVELVTRWVDGGIRRGNNPRMLPAPPDFSPKPAAPLKPPLLVQGSSPLDRAVLLDGVVPQQVPPGGSIRLTALMPDGRVEPLVWLHGYDDRYRHPFLFRRPILLPVGTVVRGLAEEASIGLIPR